MSIQKPWVAAVQGRHRSMVLDPEAGQWLAAGRHLPRVADSATRIDVWLDFVEATASNRLVRLHVRDDLAEKHRTLLADGHPIADRLFPQIPVNSPPASQPLGRRR
jgi:hypothetical protein